MFEFHDIEQNGDDWYQMRGGKITSSKLAVIMANYGKAFGEPAKRYAHQIAIERITGNAIASTYKNDAMDRGHEEEPIARMKYEEDMFCDVSNGGFFSSNKVGCSPDGLVGSDGVVEIKSAEAAIHYKRIKDQKFDSGYKWQLLGNMKFTGRKWIDFISYCSEFPEGKRLYVYRLNAVDFKDEFEMIDQRITEFWELVESATVVINESNYFLTD